MNTSFHFMIIKLYYNHKIDLAGSFLSLNIYVEYFYLLLANGIINKQII